MSVSIPNVTGTPASEFTTQQLNIFRASNAFQTLSLERFYKQNNERNIALSSLHLFSNLANESMFEPYFDLFYSNFDLHDYSPETISQDLQSIFSTIKDIDSSFVLISSCETLRDGSLFINQEIALTFFYNDAVETQKAVLGRKKEVFSLSGNLKTYENEEITAIEIPFGNENYSLIMLKPNNDLSTYVENFSETKYKSLIDSLMEHNVNIIFPKFDFTTDTLCFTLPKLTNMTEIQDSLSVKLRTKISFNSPTLAMLAANKTNTDKRITKSEYAQRIAFDDNFIFLLRGRYSNIILLLGVYSK
jgi:hypothetical protein